MRKTNDIVLQQIIPHILYVKWKIDINLKAEFIEKFGEWVWTKSRPMLKINVNDFNYIGEQSWFYLDLQEGDRESIVFIPFYNKTYRVQYGRCLGKFIFIPLIRSIGVDFFKKEECSVLKLPLRLVDD